MIVCWHGLTRVRCLHGSSRPRAFGSSFGDTEARRGSPQRGCKESAQTRPKAKAPPIFFPRFKRPGLETRFSHLACDFGVSKALAYDLRYCKVEAVTVGHRIIFGSAIVIAPRLLIQVAKKMERFDANIGALQSALEQTPEVFHAVSVDLPVHILERMVDYLVLVALMLQSLIGQERICKEFAARLDVLADMALQICLAAIGDHGSTYLTATFQQSDYRYFVFGSGFGYPATVLVAVHEASRPTNEGFVYFDFGSAPTKFHFGIGLQCEAQALEHEPCRLLSHADSAVNLPRANAVLAVGEHPHCGKPILQADSGVLEDGPYLYGELALRMASLALPDAARRHVGDILRATGRACDAILPAPRYKECNAVFRIGEVLNRFLESLGFVSHAPRLQELA